MFFIHKYSVFITVPNNLFSSPFEILSSIVSSHYSELFYRNCMHAHFTLKHSQLAPSAPSAHPDPNTANCALAPFSAEGGMNLMKKFLFLLMLKQSVASQHSRALYNKILDNTAILIYIYTAYMNNTHPISTTTE